MASRLRWLRASVASATRITLPALEGVGEQQQLGLGVERCALGVGRQPRAADLDLVGLLAPAPPAQLHEPGAADDASVGGAALGERHRGAGIALGQQVGDVALHRRRVRGHLGEAVRRPVARGGVDERTDQLALQRDQLDVASVEAERGERHQRSTVPGSAAIRAGRPGPGRSVVWFRPDRVVPKRQNAMPGQSTTSISRPRRAPSASGSWSPLQNLPGSYQLDGRFGSRAGPCAGT